MSLGHWFPKFSVNRPVTVVMGVLALSLIGVIAYFKLPLQLFPSGFNPPYLFVRIYYPNATPKEVEEFVTRPAEAMFATIRGVERMRSWSSGNSVGIFMRFNSDMSMTEIYNQVRDRLERLMPTLPEDVERYYIWRWNPDSDPIFAFGVSMKLKTRDDYELLEKKLFQPLQALSGISKVEVGGIDKPYIRIEVDRNRAKSHRISVYQLIRKLRGDNFSLPSGRLEEGGRVFYLRSQSRLKSVDDFRNYPVASGVRLKEIAKITYGVSPIPYIFRIDSREGLFIRVFKESDANTVELGKKIRAMLGQRFQMDPKMKKYRYHPFIDQGKLIRTSIEQLQYAALWGGLFALLILGVFLRHFRMTLLVTFCIPVSIVITLGCLYFMGESLNLVILMGLMLSVGMVVDNAIVVIENIARMRGEGMTLLESALEGAGEVGLAILLATATTVVVFLPLALMGGNGMFRFYMTKIATPVTIALIASLFVALLVIPLGASKLMGDKPPRAWPLFDRFTEKYRWFLDFVLRHRLDFVLLTIVLMISMRYPMKNIKTSTAGRAGFSRFSMRFTFQKNQTFASKNKYLKRIESMLEKNRKPWALKHYMTQLNRYAMTARVTVYLQDAGKRKIKIDRRSLMNKLRPLLPAEPGVIRRVGWRPIGGSQGTTLTVRMYGPDSKTLRGLAVKLEEHLRTFPEFRNVDADINRDALPELQLRLKRQWAVRYQTSARMVGGNVSYALSGRRLRDMKLGGQQIQVQIGLKRKNRESYYQLRQLPIMSMATGEPIALEYLVKAKNTRGPRVIRHANRKTYIKVTITTQKKNLGMLYMKLKQVMNTFPMPQGYSFDRGTGYRDMRNSAASRSFALMLSITFVLLLIGILFESFVLPFAVVLAIPLAFIGVYWTLFLTGTPLNEMGGIGLVMLVGIVVNHAIVMVDRINQLREEGIERHKAIVEAGTQRLRPILMTALTTVCGLLPMALGDAGLVGISYQPLGRTVMGGLIASVVLSLVVVPLFYTFFDDLREHFLSLSLRLTASKHSKDESVTPS
jgi:HAE1 family hydrophobic/amphiphilic exporter-1